MGEKAVRHLPGDGAPAPDYIKARALVIIDAIDCICCFLLG
jgi:hypothetical protein